MRMTSTMALGLLVSTLLASEAQACRGCSGGGQGRTYHFNGVQGYWSGGGFRAPVAYAQPKMAYAQQPAYASQQATYAAPRPTLQTAPTPASTVPPPPPVPST